MTQLVDVVSVISVITGFIQLLGPAPDTRAILQRRATGVTPLAPLAAMFACGWIWATYGILHSDIFPLAVNSGMNVLVATVYIAVYYRYTPNRPYAHKLLAGFALAVAAVTTYAVLGYYGRTGQSREAVTNVMGYVGNVVIFVLFAAPFENVAQVFRHRSGAFIPINIVAVNLLNAAAWLTYSLLVVDWLIFVPNAGALVICSVQIAVYVYFHPSTHPLPDGMRADGPEGDDVETALSPAEPYQAVAKQS